MPSNSGRSLHVVTSDTPAPQGFYALKLGPFSARQQMLQHPRRS